jgi:hypothetical protein
MSRSGEGSHVRKRAMRMLMANSTRRASMLIDAGVSALGRGLTALGVGGRDVGRRVLGDVPRRDELAHLLVLPLALALDGRKAAHEGRERHHEVRLGAQVDVGRLELLALQAREAEGERRRRRRLRVHEAEEGVAVRHGAPLR